MSQRPIRLSNAVSRHPKRNAEDWSLAGRALEEGYKSLQLESRLLLEEIHAFIETGPISSNDEEVLGNLQAITIGRVSTVIPVPQPVSVRELARSIVSTAKRSEDIILEDFETMISWVTSQDVEISPDRIRERLMKRKVLLEAALPETMQHLPTAALSHIERTQLGRKYVNAETMFGGRIEDIPEGTFLVSEDNYAWDMEELTQALAVNDGVMRNPFSKEMFSEEDIRNILAHPLGQSLKPIRLAQDQLKNGVHSATIDIIEKLGRTMLDDQSTDAAPSLRGIDEFLSYMATLPENEQKTINSLKIAGKDSHTGQAFDYTIGQSVRDGKANVTCFHKVGDFLSQAAAYLRGR